MEGRTVLTEITDVRRKRNSQISYICRICSRAYSIENSYKLHMLRKHDVRRRSTYKKKFLEEDCNIVCHLCSVKFTSKRNIISHLRKVHKTHLPHNAKNIQFDTLTEFFQWKRRTEMMENIRFIYKHSARLRGSATSTKIFNFKCSRDGYFKNVDKSERKRKIKSLGTRKIGRPCCAFISAKHNLKSGVVDVYYSTTHSGHSARDERDILHLPFTLEERAYLAKKILSAKSLRDVLNDLRNSATIPTDRLKYVQLMDLRNVLNNLELLRKRTKQDCNGTIDIFGSNCVNTREATAVSRNEMKVGMKRNYDETKRITLTDCYKTRETIATDCGKTRGAIAVNCNKTKDNMTSDREETTNCSQTRKAMFTKSDETREIMATSSDNTSERVVTNSYKTREIMATSSDNTRERVVTNSYETREIMATCSDKTREIMVTSSDGTRKTMATSSDNTRERVVTNSYKTREIMATCGDKTKEIMATCSDGTREIMVIDGDETRGTMATNCEELNSEKKPSQRFEIKEGRKHDGKSVRFMEPSNSASQIRSIDKMNIKQSDSRCDMLLAKSNSRKIKLKCCKPEINFEDLDNVVENDGLKTRENEFNVISPAEFEFQNNLKRNFGLKFECSNENYFDNAIKSNVMGPELMENENPLKPEENTLSLRRFSDVENSFLKLTRNEEIFNKDNDRINEGGIISISNVDNKDNTFTDVSLVNEKSLKGVKDNLKHVKCERFNNLNYCAFNKNTQNVENKWELSSDANILGGLTKSIYPKLKSELRDNSYCLKSECVLDNYEDNFAYKFNYLSEENYLANGESSNRNYADVDFQLNFSPHKSDSNFSFKSITDVLDYNLDDEFLSKFHNFDDASSSKFNNFDDASSSKSKSESDDFFSNDILSKSKFGDVLNWRRELELKLEACANALCDQNCTLSLDEVRKAKNYAAKLTQILCKIDENLTQK